MAACVGISKSVDIRYVFARKITLQVHIPYAYQVSQHIEFISVTMSLV